ncbi:MAG: MATE family efflux transporter [Ruminococcus sp.]|nr:MATE family efflux transporter [Ruminococcus sp.]
MKKQEIKVAERDKMEILPVRSLMLRMGIPIIFSMMMQAFYNIVDSAFVSNMPKNGETALNALTLAFPMQMLMVAIGIGTGVGVNALLSKSMGEGNREKASKTAGNGLFLACIIFALFLILGFVGVTPYIQSQTDNSVVADMASDYLFICCIFSFGLVAFNLYEKLLQATGNSLLSTIAQISGAVTNIILDPILIYGWFGFPEMGVQGAAYATIIGQIVSGLLSVIFHLKVNKNIKNGVTYIKPSAHIIGQIYKIGLPAIIAQALMSVMTYGLNIILGNVSDMLVTAYGLYYKIQQFILFAAFGLRDAITPIVSYSHGMKSKKRVCEGIKYGMTFTVIIMVIGLVLIEVLAVPFSKIFGLSGTTLELCISAMRIISISFIFAGVNIAFQGIFQALNGGIESLIVSVCRQLVFILPVAWGFSMLVNSSLDNAWLVWLTFPIAEIVSSLIAVLLMLRVNKKEIKVLS